MPACTRTHTYIYVHTQVNTYIDTSVHIFIYFTRVYTIELYTNKTPHIREQIKQVHTHTHIFSCLHGIHIWATRNIQDFGIGRPVGTSSDSVILECEMRFLDIVNTSSLPPQTLMLVLRGFLHIMNGALVQTRGISWYQYHAYHTLQRTNSAKEPSSSPDSWLDLARKSRCSCPRQVPIALNSKP